ncbi:NFACT family protein [Paenibacillus yanchengensis]|uniref:Rqc2 homolog RqcH n=1 Tax=Paenibacillus yanchengensis TaxID=2035833 RepID=A0ABW4YN45_9BACL
MALDGIVVSAIAAELANYIGTRIYKIHQPNPHDLIFTLRTPEGQKRLLLSANPTYPRVHFTERTFVNPIEAPMFCMLLRKHCEGGVIESITQVGLERVLHFDIVRRDELGDWSKKKIVIEIMGRHSNIILLDEESNIVHDGIHHVTPAISSHRVILPGVDYIAPPAQHKVNLLTIDNEQQFQDLWNQEDLAMVPEEKRIVQLFSGISPLTAKQLLYNAEQLPSLWSSLSELKSKIEQKQYEPTVVTETATDKTYFSAIPLTHIAGEHTEFPSIHHCLEYFYGTKADRDTVKQRASDLIRFVQNEKNKNESKINKLKEQWEDAQQADDFRIRGELLTAYLHEINRGDTEVTLNNFYDENAAALTISLDPSIAPAENAQRYFRKYNKIKNSLSYITEQSAIAQAEIDYFTTILQQLDNASLADIEEIREELIAGSYLKEKVKKGSKKKKSSRPTLLHYTSSEGITIIVGKNNTQNDYLTNKVAHVSDTWLHTKDIPGSHVVIRSTDFGEATLQEAAILAAYYSQARNSSSVPVDYTTIRHVRKPNGAKPGFVIYDQQKTIYVTPEENFVQSLPFKVS